MKYNQIIPLCYLSGMCGHLMVSCCSVMTGIEHVEEKGERCMGKSHPYSVMQTYLLAH